MENKNIMDDIEKVLVSEEEIKEAIQRMARQIDEYYADKDGKLVLLCILKGSVVVMGELMKYIKTPVEIDFMKVSSYCGGTKTTGNVSIILDIHRKDLPDANIVVVEDIIDSGNTLAYLVEYLKLKGAKSVKICTLLDKPDRREKAVTADWVGKVVPNEFVVGYGLDYDEKYRALPFVGVLKPEAYGGKS